MKNILIGLFAIGGFLCGSCTDWLEVYPKNEQITENYWKEKEDVESVLAAGYSSLRSCTRTLVDWGELRGASIYAYSDTKKQKLQNFRITASDALCSWASIYKVLNLANSVIKYAPEVQAIDKTYQEVSMNSHLCEAYFLRGLCHFYLVRNFGSAPIVTEPYVDDSAPYDLAKSTEAEMIAQIKADIQTALATGAAKEFYDDDEWAGADKGRATIWALYALMADVCLWSEDYDNCIKYCDLLINADATYRPVFMSDPEQWFSIFSQGNSNESIFEINWDLTNFAQTEDNRGSSPSYYFTLSTTAAYQYTEAMCEDLYNESSENGVGSTNASVRAQWGAYVDMNTSGTADKKQYCIWKYKGYDYQDVSQVRPNDDANFIIYRMTEILLMKAEALVWKGASGYAEAIQLINQVRNRARLSDVALMPESATEEEMLQAILHERNIEFAAEGKRWYDLLRFGKSQNYKYKSQFIDIITTYNSTANSSWLRSVLKSENAWYLPINQTEINNNSLLVQNPYYADVNE